MRHNLGVVNDFDEPVTLTLLWGHMEDGVQHTTRMPWRLRPASALQSRRGPAPQRPAGAARHPVPARGGGGLAAAHRGLGQPARWRCGSPWSTTSPATPPSCPTPACTGGDDFSTGRLYRAAPCARWWSTHPARGAPSGAPTCTAPMAHLTCYSPARLAPPRGPAPGLRRRRSGREISEVLVGEVAQPPGRGYVDELGHLGTPSTRTWRAPSAPAPTRRTSTRGSRC